MKSLINPTNVARLFALTLGTASLGAPLAAQQPVQQVPQPAGAKSRAQLAFGYQCDDKFALRNEGTSAVTVEFGVAGTTERGSATVQPNETVQLESQSPDALELYVDGKLVASEAKGDRPCTAPQGAPQAAVSSDVVVVRHYEPAQIVYVQPTEYVYVRPWDDYYYGGYYGGPVINVGWGSWPYTMGHRGGLPRPVRPPFVRERDGNNGPEGRRGGQEPPPAPPVNVRPTRPNHAPAPSTARPTQRPAPVQDAKPAPRQDAKPAPRAPTPSQSKPAPPRLDSHPNAKPAEHRK